MGTWPVLGEPRIPYFWDPTCEMGQVGCWADGIHAECRFCGHGVYRSIDCPNTTTITRGPRILLQAEETEDQSLPAPAEAELSAKEPSQSVERAAKTHEDWLDGDETPLSGTGGVRCTVVMFCTAVLLA